MNTTQRTARLAGVFFILTFVTSIPAYLLYGPVLDHPGYILGSGSDGRIEWGAFLEIFTVITNIATAVVLFPVLKRWSESISLGYVATRIVESTLIVVGVASLLAVVNLRQDLVGSSGADAASIANAGRSLVAVHDATFLLDKSGLVPRRLALLGLVGGPLAFVSRRRCCSVPTSRRRQHRLR
jgi:hypothetical protein